MNLGEVFTRGIIKENPVLRLALGLCPSLAVSSSVFNAIGMGVSVLFVLIMSNLLISLVRKGVPAKIRIPIFIVIIATFVTIVEMVMAAYAPGLFKALGIFVPLIVVNCIILGRAEAFASKNGPVASIVDAVGMSAGFTLALVLIAIVREVLGNGTISLPDPSNPVVAMAIQVVPGSFEPILLFMLAPGAFITMGLWLALFNLLDARKAEKKKQETIQASFQRSK